MDKKKSLASALAERTRLINATDEEIASILSQAADSIVAILSKQPTEYQSWYLPQIYKQIQSALQRFGTEAGTAAAVNQRAAWLAGSSMVDAAIEQASVARAALPVIDDLQLRAMSSFLTEKISGITLEAANAINTELGLVVMGAQTPFDAIQKVQQILGESATRRAKTIVHTELARAHSTATHLRMLDQAKVVPGLKKKWLKSGKVHPRHNHVLMHNQVRDVDQPFDIPGGGQIMYPHDPAAPASETINCGCCEVPDVPGWDSTLPPEEDGNDAVPVSQVLARHGHKA